MAQWINIQAEQQFNNEVQKGPVVAIFGSSSNMVWNMARGPIEAFSHAVPSWVRFIYVDQEDLPELVKKQNVRVIPTARFLLSGKKVSELSGEDVNVENISEGLEQLQGARA